LILTRNIARISIQVIYVHHDIVLIDLAPCNEALSLQIYHKLGAFAQFTFDVNFAAHLFDDVLTDRETQACALRVALAVLVELGEINEKFFATFF
jgi:hypothetical protein